MKLLLYTITRGFFAAIPEVADVLGSEYHMTFYAGVTSYSNRGSDSEEVRP